MKTEYIDGFHLANMFKCGAAVLSHKTREVDALNVFPVPDGDTGTNMTLTIKTGIAELEKVSLKSAGDVANVFSRGLLMGARGNSGVILSQLFRGFSKAVETKHELTAIDLVRGLEEGVEVAYKAVMKPVEGTILTVARLAAEAAREALESAADINEVMQHVLQAAKAALAETPNQLPILKEAGVVDSGGQGLVYIYDGFLQSLQGKSVPATAAPSVGETARSKHGHSFAAEIKFGYCTEFFIKLRSSSEFSLANFQNQMGRFGDSLLVVEDDGLVKIHIHAEYPGEVMTFSQRYGELTGIKIENMREQNKQWATDKRRYAIVAVCVGDGFQSIYKGLGADVIVDGGQTMNPSTEELIRVVSKIDAEQVIFLPNNKNIILAAEQAAKLLPAPAYVVPTLSIPQGISALLSLNMDLNVEDNLRAMNRSLKNVKTGEITLAVRDTVLSGREIRFGNYIGLVDGDIFSIGTSFKEVALKLIAHMVSDESSIVTLYYGIESSRETVLELVEAQKSEFSEVEWEIQPGGQPLYPLIISVE